MKPKAIKTSLSLFLAAWLFSACMSSQPPVSSYVPLPSATITLTQPTATWMLINPIDTPTPTFTSTGTQTLTPAPTKSCIAEDGQWSGWIGKATYVFFTVRACRIVKSGITIADSTPASYSMDQDEPIARSSFTVADNWQDASIILQGRFTSATQANILLTIQNGTKIQLSTRTVSFNQDWVAEFQCSLNRAETSTPQATIPIPEPTQVNTTPACIQAVFDSDLSIPELSLMSPNTTFVKSWRIRNDGTCTWTTDFSVVFDQGDLMQGPASQPLANHAIAPGETVDIWITLTAPSEPSLYKGFWLLSSQTGQRFGTGSANIPLKVWIAVVR